MFRKNFKSSHLTKFLKDRQLAKLEALAAACGEKCDDEFMLATINNLIKVIPTSVKPCHLVTPEIQKMIEEVGRDGELVTVTLKSGTKLFTLPSRQQYRNYYYCFRHKLPAFFTPETYQACHDVRVRYLKGSEIIKGLTERGLFEPSDNASIIECGAYNGWKALGFAKHTGKRGKVLVLEIDKIQHDIAFRNLSANVDKDRYMLMHTGVYNQVQEMTYTFEHCASHTLKTPDEHDHHTQEGVIRTDTLDNIIDRSGVEVFDFINIQTGGSELESAQGLERNLDRIKVLYLGTHYRHDGISIRHRCIDYLLGRGCRIHRREKGEITSASQVPKDEVGGFFAVSPAYADKIVPRECR